MIRRPTKSTRTDTLFPTRRSSDLLQRAGGGNANRWGRSGRVRQGPAPPPATAGEGWEGVPTVRADLEDTPPQPVRPASTAGVRSLAREPMVRKRAASPPAFAGEGAKARG